MRGIGRFELAGKFPTYDFASPAATLVADASLLLILRDPRGAGASICNLDASVPTVLRYARVKHPTAKLQTAGFGRDH